MDITRQMLKDLRPEIEDALKEVSEKYGITMKLGNGRFGGLTGDYKLLLTTIGENGETPESRDFALYASRFGMDQSWLGKTFNVNANTYTIKGILPKKTKRPILVVRGDGAERIMDHLSVRRAMKLEGYDVPNHWADNPTLTVTDGVRTVGLDN
jgi:hypothetical protein